MTKRRFYAGLVAMAALLFSACHDTIFETIDEEIEVDDAGISGTISSIVEFNGNLYLSAGHAGELYRKSTTSVSRKEWRSISVVGSNYCPIYLGTDNNTLYMIAYTYEDDDGYNSPTYHEFCTTDLATWTGPQTISKDDYEGIGHLSGTPLHPDGNVYVNKYTQVRASNGYTYSIVSGTDGDTKIYRDGTEILNTSDSDTGRLWAITATEDYIIIGSNQGLYRLKINDDGTLGAPDESFSGDGAKSIFGGFRCYIVYVPDAFRDSNEGAAPIYAYKDARGSSYVAKEGFYAFYPATGWNRDGTNSSSGN